MKLKRGEILFVAHAGWAASGAKLLGYPAYWVGRQNLPPEEFGAFPDGPGDTLLSVGPVPDVTRLPHDAKGHAN
jgi:hypothetical protein